MTPQTIPQGYLQDAKGRLVPLSLVSDVDRQRNELVLELIELAQNLQESMINVKLQAMADIQAFVELSAEKYDVKMGGHKGNITLTSFDGKYKVQVAVGEHIAFDERLQAAKKLIDECLTDWTGDSRDEVKTIVMDAFQVDKEGGINTGRILALRRLSIDDERWHKAQEAIADSIQVVGSKTYIRFYERSGPDDKFVPIALDMAVL